MPTPRHRAPRTPPTPVPTGGPTPARVGIPKKIAKENQFTAAMFLKFLTSPENTVAFSAATGYMPVRKSAKISSLTARAPQIQVAIDQLDVTRTQDRARVFFPGGDQEMTKTCANILTSRADTATELGRPRTTLEKIYTRAVKPNV